MPPNLDAWDAWHPRLLAGRLAGLEFPWYVAAGWALDLFVGAPTRRHADLEIAVPAARFGDLAARFADCDFHVPYDGDIVPATAATLEASHQTWALERATGRWRCDVFREPHDGDTWIYRRDERIRRPYAEIVEHGVDGVPYLAPEIVLLFKAKQTRDKDEVDFRMVLPLLDVARRRWLEDALLLVNPEHPWRAVLAAAR
ncbi:hypothetical protein [Plantactinospora sp. B5E13]|uniref:nucleotidyltransferase domain-containing protein n=1 Tax=unclassified Plantactinospora TaxID=2631981 RepID=UPI00325CF0B5